MSNNIFGFAIDILLKAVAKKSTDSRSKKGEIF